MDTTLSELAAAHEDAETGAVDFYELGRSIGTAAHISQNAELLIGLQEGLNADPELTSLRYAILRVEVAERGTNLDTLIAGLTKREGE